MREAGASLLEAIFGTDAAGSFKFLSLSIVAIFRNSALIPKPVTRASNAIIYTMTAIFLVSTRISTAPAGNRD